jgi:hypothetical protein
LALRVEAEIEAAMTGFWEFAILKLILTGEESNGTRESVWPSDGDYITVVREESRVLSGGQSVGFVPGL